MNLRNTVGEVFKQVVDQGSELTAVQTKQWDQSHEMANQLQGSLQDIKDREIGALVLAVYGMREQLVSYQSAHC